MWGKRTFSAVAFLCFNFILIVSLSHAQNNAEYLYDPNGRIQSITQPNGQVLMYEHDQNGNRISSITASPSLSYTFSQLGNSFSADIDYSNVQGFKNWFYLEGSEGNYKSMVWDGYWKGSSQYLLIGKGLQHPEHNDSVLKWLAPQTGLIRITGTVAKSNTSCGDGVRVKIKKDNAQIWPLTGWQEIAYNDSKGFSIDRTVSVNIGDSVFFIVNQGNESGCDGTNWSPTITYNQSDVASVQFSSVQGGGNWFYQEWDGTTYRNLSWNSSTNYWVGSHPFNLIAPGALHPNQYDSVLKWEAPKTGIVRITGKAAKGNKCGDGVNIRILKNGTLVWPSNGWKEIAPNDDRGIDIQTEVGILEGDFLYFIVNKKGNFDCDLTNWDPILTYINSNDSVASYSSTQGNNGWYYQEKTSTGYKNLTWNGSYWEGDYKYTLIAKGHMHPDETDSVLKWVAPKSGLIKITGKAAKNNTGCGDGVRLKILKNQSLLWPNSGSGWKELSYNDSIGLEINQVLSIATGDSLYFIVNKNENNLCDGTDWRPSISYYNSFSASSDYSSTQGFRGWFYQEWNGQTYQNLRLVNGYWNGSYNYTILDKNLHHPDLTDSVRKWVAPSSGLIRITGRVAKENIGGGDGVKVKIVHQEKQLWPSTGWRHIPYNDSIGVEVDQLLRVKSGDAIYFIVNQNGNNSFDGTNWDPSITYYFSNS